MTDMTLEEMFSDGPTGPKERAAVTLWFNKEEKELYDKLQAASRRKFAARIRAKVREEMQKAVALLNAK